MNKIYNKINEILAEWNPIGVDIHIAEDEYKGYIPQILKYVGNKEQLKGFLEEILINKMGVGYDPQNINHSEDLRIICDKLIQAYLLAKEIQ